MKIQILFALVSALLQVTLSGDCDCDGPPEPPQPVDGHPSDHDHPDNATFLYQDSYVRVVEGETVELCARLNHSIDREFYVEYFMEPLSAEKYEDYEYIQGVLTFEPGATEKCIRFNTTDDDNAGEENIESFYVGWYIQDAYDKEIYIYDTEEYDDEGFTVVSIEDNDVLTLIPNTTSITVYEGDYSFICVTPDEEVRDSPALFYVLFDDKHSHGYTADIYHDLQYTHVHDYDGFYYYGGIYGIDPEENKTCFHFHTYDDDKFEGNEEFAIKLFSFTPLSFYNEGSDRNRSHYDLHRHPFIDLFHHNDFDDDYGSDHHRHGNHGHHSDHDEKEYEDFLEYFERYAVYFSEHYTFDTFIPEPLSTIHVTIVDNEPAPCPQENTAPCFQLMKDVMCMHLQNNAESKHNIPRPCRRFNGGLLGGLQRHDPHPNRD